MSTHTVYSSRKMKTDVASRSASSSHRSVVTQKSSNHSVSGVSLGFTVQTQNAPYTLSDPPVSEFKLEPSIRSKQFSPHSTMTCSVTSESTTRLADLKAEGPSRRGSKRSTSKQRGSSTRGFHKKTKGATSMNKWLQCLEPKPFKDIHVFKNSSIQTFFCCHFVCDHKVMQQLWKNCRFWN